MVVVAMAFALLLVSWVCANRAIVERKKNRGVVMGHW